MHKVKEKKTAVVGLGYVGMPLALALAQYGSVIGYDCSESRIKGLSQGIDSNNEIDKKELAATKCVFTSNSDDIKNCDVFIVTVPTPIDDDNQPDLTALKSASQTVGQYIKPGDIVVYESTVYPGVTENICGPVLEHVSGLVCGKDFYLGYSPERINPGDREHVLSKIAKVVAGQTPEVTEFLAEFYGQINAGNIFKAKNIKTAEASKAIENAQRDINVAFINEVTVVLNKLGLSAFDVLDAAKTKWNFLPFTPGLVGGHCIGVDPYYLAQCARDIGHDPEVILSGRKINDAMGNYVATRMHQLLQKSHAATDAKILILGFTFKENINDIRNSKVIDVIRELQRLGHDVDVHDPYADNNHVLKEYGISLLGSLPDIADYNCLGLCVAHDAYMTMDVPSIEKLLSRKSGIVYDIKGLWRARSFGNKIEYQGL